MQLPMGTLLASQNAMYDYKIQAVHTCDRASEEPHR